MVGWVPPDFEFYLVEFEGPQGGGGLFAKFRKGSICSRRILPECPLRGCTFQIAKLPHIPFLQPTHFVVTSFKNNEVIMANFNEDVITRVQTGISDYC